MPGQRAAVAVEAKGLLAAEAKKRQQSHGETAPGKPKITSIKNDISYPPKPSTPAPSVEKTVAKQFDVSQGYVHAAQGFSLRRLPKEKCRGRARYTRLLQTCHYRGLSLDSNNSVTTAEITLLLPDFGQRFPY